MDGPKLSDKAPLELFLGAIHEQIVTFIQRAEARHPEYQAGAFEVTVRVALRPETAPDQQSARIWADMDPSRSQQVTDLTIPFRRAPTSCHPS